jgi:hypothetical protein
MNQHKNAFNVPHCSTVKLQTQSSDSRELKDFEQLYDSQNLTELLEFIGQKSGFQSSEFQLATLKILGGVK